MLRIRDLGRVQYECGERVVPMNRTRRKAASLLTLLVTRPNQTATKEQVIEELWPDLDVGPATNSYNQTLYFLRRDIDEWYDAPTSPVYLVNDGELVWLDKTLVHADSVAFMEELSGMTAGENVEGAANMCKSYLGRFAPEFEYDDWAVGWRERVHAAYLDLLHQTVVEYCRRDQLRQALGLLQLASRIDPESVDLDPTLVWIYDRLGSTAAAVEQYRRLSQSYRSELGTKPPSMQTILQSDPAQLRQRDL
jgi:DNA-binding SARP family transcriptional activator